MAWTDVTCFQCGEIYRVQMYGPNRERERRVRTWSGLCDDCKAAKREEEYQQAQKWAAENEMPKLSGSEKQIRWAEALRMKRIETIQSMLSAERGNNLCYSGRDMARAGLVEQGKEGLSFTDLGEECFDWICQQNSARYWIESRDIFIEEMFKEAAKNLPAKEEPEPEVIQNFTLRPENPSTETIAEITSHTDYILIHFPEKRNDFWELVKKGLDYRWTGQTWKLKVNAVNAPAEDRVVEAGHRLLTAGFCVLVHDATLRQRIIDANYSPAPTRWISKRVTGDYAGWFTIGWNRWKNEDWYREAKKLPSTRYSKPNIVVPAEHFQEVLDFAEYNRFHITEGAKSLVSEAEAKKQAAITVNPANSPEQDRAKPGQRPNLDNQVYEQNVNPELLD